MGWVEWLRIFRDTRVSVGRASGVEDRHVGSAWACVQRRGIACARLAIAVLVLEAGACSEPVGQKKDVLGFSELEQAARARDFAKLKEFVAARADLNVADSDQVTVLHRAARDGDLEVAQFLLSYGARPDVTTSTGWTPLHLAAREGKPKLVETLLLYKADPLARLPDGRTALHIACAKNDYPTVEILLADWVYKERPDKDNGVNIKDAHGDMPLHLALGKRDTRIATVLVGKGADVNASDGKGVPPLVTASALGNDLLAGSLLTKGANPNVTDAKGRTALRAAFDSGNTTLVQLLQQWGAR